MASSKLLSEEQRDLTPAAPLDIGEEPPMPNAHYTASARNGQAGGFPVLDAFPMPQSPAQPPVWQVVLNFVKSEWKWLLTGLVPLLIAGGWLALPASTAQLQKLKDATAAEVALLKTDISGQFQVVHTRVDGLNNSLQELHTDIRELLRRIPAYRSDLPPPPIAASAPPALPPAANPPKKSRPKPNPQAKTGIWSLLR
jgi:hypothetical protein